MGKPPDGEPYPRPSPNHKAKITGAVDFYRSSWRRRRGQCDRSSPRTRAGPRGGNSLVMPMWPIASRLVTLYKRAAWEEHEPASQPIDEREDAMHGG